MRITGGQYCRRNIVCPPGVIRPAMDRMRESLFSILGDLTGCSFLDLFSGSGCVAIEAASRGASPIHLVEMDRGKKATIEKNLSFVNEDKHLFMMDVNRYISSCLLSYDIVYADPPFPMDGKVELSEKIANRHIVKPGGLYIIHYPAEEHGSWPEKIEGFTFKDERKYGRSLLRFYKAD
ncbi:MAG: 16S rRNA (guanine(966)-N(2))-methyltransferase RsmD [Sphaerochaetaceae bacterium]|nr:16S rRNA (guanine(966)-N(2))-methyltransferase RsmD [Sphaerochaetaceae bacterium]